MKIKAVDALVHAINTTTLQIHRDTVVQNQPAIGLTMHTYLTALTDSVELKKYVSDVYITASSAGKVEQTATNNTFYFDHNKLIKVEEYIIKDTVRSTADWYYTDDQPIYYTLRTDKAQKRAMMLLEMARQMVETLRKKGWPPR